MTNREEIEQRLSAMWMACGEETDGPALDMRVLIVELLLDSRDLLTEIRDLLASPPSAVIHGSINGLDVSLTPHPQADIKEIGERIMKVFLEEQTKLNQRFQGEDATKLSVDWLLEPYTERKE